MSMPLWSRSAAALLPELRSGALKAETLMASVLGQIDARNAPVNAFSHIAAESALAEAREADRQLAAGSTPGPLHGLPFTVKDLVAVAGMPLEYASHAFAGQVADADAEAVARLRRAGAIPFAKSTTPEFGHKVLTDSPRHGISRNPWNTDYSCGGSSGGAAIAAAMGFGPLHLTSDGAGSGRIPASCCGVVGLKPSWGAVPHETTTDLFGSLTCLGQMGRTVADVTLMFNAMKGPDRRDPLSFGGSAGPVRLPDDPVAALKGLRLRYAPRMLNRWLSPQVEAAVGETVARLLAAGAARVAMPEDIAFDTASALVLMRAYQHARFGSLLEEHGAGMDRTARLGLTLQPETQTYSRLAHAQRARTEIYRQVERLFDGADVFITPTVATPALPVGQQSDGPLVVDGIDHGPLRDAWYPYTIPYNASGHPAISVPCGMSTDGLPIGLQIVGPWHGEAQLLAVAAAIEALSPWAANWPALSGTEHRS
jgi:aspartyl-tRNA(Asn)/glutamyl-tRNA(Gln) amidotransferase subunit A